MNFSLASSDHLKSALASSLRAGVGQVLRWAPTQVWRELFPKTAVGLCYHMVSDTPLPHLKHYPELSSADFEADLIYLQKNFGFVSYEQLVRRRSCPKVVRDNPVMLTFDDGFAECANVAAPILLRHGASCVFFVITDLIDNAVVFRESKASLCIEAILRLPIENVDAIVRDLALDARFPSPPERSLFGPANLPLDIANFGRQIDPRLRPLLHWLLTIAQAEEPLVDRLCTRLNVDLQGYQSQVQPYLTTQQIRQLQADGFVIGAHSCSHRKLQGLSQTDAEREIVESCRIVRDLTGQKSVPFAFPYSGAGIDRKWLAELRRVHHFIGLFFDSGGLIDDERFVVQRVFAERIGAAKTIDAILRGAWSRRPAWRRRD